MSKVAIRAARLSVSCLALIAGSQSLRAAETPAAADKPATTDQAPAANDVADIIVTAQKRPEKLQQISVAASVLSAATLEQQHVVDLSDINRVVPSVEIKGTFNGRVPYGVRGISTNANEGAIGLTSGVSIQVDGVPVPADSFAANTITDVAQLEVLKGPQSTLGGRTASAGVINFVTFAPTSTPHFAINFLQTTDGEHHVDVRATGPIAQGLSYSLTGYYQYTPYPVVNLATGQKSEAESDGIRGKLKWDASENLDITLMGHYALSTSSGENFVPTYFTPGAVFFAPPVGLTQADMFPGLNIRYGNNAYNSTIPMGSKYKDKDGALVINYHLGTTTITSTTSLFHEDQDQSQLVFEGADPNFAIKFEGFLNAIGVLPGFLVQPFYPVQSANGFVRQTTEELKIASDASQPLSVIAGAFYSDMTVNQTAYRNWTLNPLAKDNISTTRNYAIYARATAKISEFFGVVGGLRYNWDKVGWNISEYFNPAAGIYGDGAFGQGGFTWDLHDNSSALVGDIALQAHPDRNVMAYASYTRGYKPKAFNTAHDFATPQDAASASDLASAVAARQEHIDSFEVGLKSTLLNRHLTFNIDAFHTNYANYQAQIFSNASNSLGELPPLILASAGAFTEGVEADLNYVMGATRMSLSGAYINAKFENFAGAPCYPSQTAAQGCVNNASGQAVQDLTGAHLPASPKVKISASIQQTVAFKSFDMMLGSNVSYRSSTLLQADQNPQTNQPAFALLDLSVGFRSKDRQATLAFFVNNVTNHFYYSNMEDFFASATTGNYVIGQPARDARRYFGARLSFEL